MPRRVHILQRVVNTIAVTVQGLGIGGTLHNDIRADEPAGYRVIVARAVVVQAGAVQPLSGELFIGGDVACPGAAKGIVGDGINVRIYSLIVNVSTMRLKAMSVPNPTIGNNTSMSIM